MNEISLLSAFVMGLAGSGHCLVMCGGIASSLQLASKQLSAVVVTLLYNIGRISSYALAGSLVALLGASLAKQNTSLAIILQLMSGIFMVLVAIYVMRLASTLKWLESFAKSLIWQHIVKLNRYLVPVNTKTKAFCYGALWGWLPCGLVYSALTWTLQAKSATEGALIMLAFGIGTMPALIVIGQSAQLLQKFINHLVTRIIMGNLLIWYGVYLIIIATDKLVH
ncbi:MULTISPECIES: sulfite exporter TauE/SafE family protein [Pseudoalteromonas]|uniref:sulfite exporter TauE/SafE family protein n=1 Tax=Pseudoalteromonas TaxID=53246 RepID=UPI00083D5248|nr:MULTISPECIES: sulfite exporter TauE/SafE family protein [Pseudoalteromonas]ODB34222.1 cytochrome biogenesis protein [Pseudoalteromonas sp. BMB]QUI63821.1 sulfite exporter TauE/SafE family protein [Pseudoalteromonas sp. A22]QZO11555.1 sulfite exporter TauE/SafE family protein [Pseudoalteromonas piscicida]USE69518.1 sulfite exporter TauE/SafE family protein [Pseudoalteromonas flavipulchra]